MSDDAKASKRKSKKGRSVKSKKSRTKNLMLAADSAIERLEAITRPGGEIEQMDIKELKNLISSIRDLASVTGELKEEKERGGVIVLPEVPPDE